MVIPRVQVKNGLPRDVALRLAAQTVLGSAKMTQGEKPRGVWRRP